MIFFIGSLLSSSASETSGFIILKSLGELLASVLRSDLTHIGLIEYALPTDMVIEKLDVVQSNLALGLVGSILTVFLFYTVIRTSRWPFQDGRFNLWMNLPIRDVFTKICQPFAYAAWLFEYYHWLMPFISHDSCFVFWQIRRREIVGHK